MQQALDIDLTVYQTEEELLEGLRRRDRMACTCLVKRFMPRLYRLAMQITGNAEEAEEAVQDGFISACVRIESFEGRSTLGSWLHRVVLNAALTQIRKRKPATMPLIEEGAAAATFTTEALVDASGDPGDHLLSKELRTKLDEAILALPDSLRAAFALRDLEGLSTAEAASVLEISEPALKVRLHRARLALREALKPYMQESSDGAQDASRSRNQALESGENKVNMQRGGGL